MSSDCAAVSQSSTSIASSASWARHSAWTCGEHHRGASRAVLEALPRPLGVTQQVGGHSADQPAQGLAGAARLEQCGRVLRLLGGAHEAATAERGVQRGHATLDLPSSPAATAAVSRCFARSPWPCTSSVAAAASASRAFAAIWLVVNWLSQRSTRPLEPCSTDSGTPAQTRSPARPSSPAASAVAQPALAISGLRVPRARAAVQAASRPASVRASSARGDALADDGAGSGRRCGRAPRAGSRHASGAR